MRFLRCFIYLSLISIFAFLLGRILPKKWFRADLFPYRTYKFEKNGKIYNKIKIRKWQNKVPDMSKILPFMMPPKSIDSTCEDKIPRMIQETCVAEFIHSVNCLAGLFCIKICPDIVGYIIVLLYIFVFNVPYILIQRYNRPRLVELYKKLETRKSQLGKAVA